MKKLNCFILVLCSVAYISILGACENDADETSPLIDIQGICGTYAYEQVKMTFNGDEILSSGEVTLALIPSATSKSENRTTAKEKMLLEIPPLWPNVRDNYMQPVFENIIIEVDAVSSSEQVTFTGVVTQPIYKLTVEGAYKEGELTLNLNYSTTYSMIGNTYIFDFSKESLNMGMLNPNVEFVEWEGIQVPVREFVTDAIAPVFEVIGKRLGGALCIEFFSDGHCYLGIKSQVPDTTVPVPGNHGYRYFGNDFGYLMSDNEGAMWVSKTVSDGFTLNNAIYTSRVGNFYFMPVFFSKGNSDNKLLFALGNPVGNCFQNFLFDWLDTLGTTELAVEELAKANKVAMMLNNKTIQYIRLIGTAIK